MRKSFMVLPMAAAVIGVGATPSFAAIRTVDDDKVQCPGAAFTSIQAAVDAAAPGDSIQVCNGTYRETVTVDKNNIDVVSKVVRGATISPPAGELAEPRALVHLTGSNDKIRRFRIVGPGNGTADSLRFGVLVDDNANEVAATVSENLIADIRDIEAAANEDGVGVAVGDFRDGVSHPGRATVQKNEIVRYQKAGVRVDESQTYANVANNTVRGLGLELDDEAIPAQQGIQVAFGAAASVTANKVSENKYGGDGSQATSFGILVLFTSTAKDPFGKQVSQVKGNTLTNNDAGLEVFDVQNWLFQANRVMGNGDPNTSAGDAGIDVGESGPGTGGNNRFIQNDARTNDGPDCADSTTGSGTAGTGNLWQSNRGIDDVPDGICAP